eukprot:TRINITY_DN7004_c1_g2_i2.p3 TRINITY_DN7004_c1_g2~~TRINITY_DN7004_c1_g2_i2.p3  ORF type:complete len:151 (+),score=41.61 TRINITY_DN7004_c1_g2_i2:436-888(+)
MLEAEAAVLAPLAKGPPPDPGQPWTTEELTARKGNKDALQLLLQEGEWDLYIAYIKASKKTNIKKNNNKGSLIEWMIANKITRTKQQLVNHHLCQLRCRQLLRKAIPSLLRRNSQLLQAQDLQVARTDNKPRVPHVRLQRLLRMQQSSRR